MKTLTNYFYIFSAILLLFLTVSCSFEKLPKRISKNENIRTDEKLRFDFDIILKEVKSYKEMKIRDYFNSNLLATLKQVNISDEKIELGYPRFFVFENYEVKSVKGDDRDSLINNYHYSIIFDPENFENERVELEPGNFIVDTLNLINDFKFYLSDSDTLLIRLKKHYFEKHTYSNWDTLIIK